MRDLTVDLEKIGLSDKEAKVYLAALELGADTAQNISKRAAVNRATTYVAIKTLTDMGLIGTFEKGKKQYFRASSPEKLLDLYERSYLDAQAKKVQIENIIPSLKRLHTKPGEKSRVKYFEGKEALLSMVSGFYREMDGGTILTFSPVDRVREIFSSEELNKLQEQRISRGVSLRALYTHKDATIIDRHDRKARRIPYDKFPLNSDVAIYGDQVHIVSLGDQMSGVVIEDKQFANTFRSIFELAWEGAERYQ